MSSVCYCTPLLFLLLSGDQLQGGDQKDGVALIDSKEGGCSVISGSQLHHHSAVKSVETRAMSERVLTSQPGVCSNSITVSVEHGRRKKRVPISHHITPVHTQG